LHLGHNSNPDTELLIVRWVLNITNKLFSVEQLNEEKVRSVRADFHLRESMKIPKFKQRLGKEIL
jgi:hypothetical protein